MFGVGSSLGMTGVTGSFSSITVIFVFGAVVFWLYTPGLFIFNNDSTTEFVFSTVLPCFSFIFFPFASLAVVSSFTTEISF